MTEYNWDDMETRERDALVAEEVMGIDVAPKGEFRSSHSDPGIHRTNVPNFTTDISAAWEVVEKMYHSKDGLNFSDELHLMAKGQTKPPLIFFVSPERICLAALRAKGIDI